MGELAVASTAAAAVSAEVLRHPFPIPSSKPIPKPELAAAKPLPVPAPVHLKPNAPKPQLVGPPKQPAHVPPPPVKIPTELTKPRPKPSVVIEQPITEPRGPDAKDAQGGMSHLDAILARNGLGHYIGNDYNTKRPEEYLLTENYRRRDRSETKSGENTPSRPSSTSSNISHRTILHQQQKQVKILSFTLFPNRFTINNKYLDFIIYHIILNFK